VDTVSQKERGHGSHGGSMRGWHRRKVMTGGPTCHPGEERRWREVRRFHMREAAIGQGATNARSAGPRG
jgi:hypothetical protein